MNYIRERMMSGVSNTQQSSGATLAEEHIQEINFDDNRFNLNAILASGMSQISDHCKSELSVSYAEQSYGNRSSWSVEHNMRIPEITDSTYHYLWKEGKDGHFNVQSWDGKFIVHYGASPAYSMKAGVHFEQFQYNTIMKNNLLVQIDDFISVPPHYNRAFNDTMIIDKYSWFYQEERRLFPNLKIQAGIRYDHFSLKPKGYLNPRIVIHYDLPKEIKTQLAFGTFSRLPGFDEMRQHMLERFKPGYKPGDSVIKIQTITKYMAGIQKTFAAYALVDINYFYKEMKNLIPIQRLSDGSLLYNVKNRARVLSRGVEINTTLSYHILSLRCRYKYTDSFENTSDRQNYPYHPDQRHSLSLSLNTKLSGDWHVGLQAIYGSGYAYTPCVLPEYDWDLGYDLDSTPIWEFQTDHPNSAWYPEYSRLDVAFRKGFILPFGMMTLSVNLINVLNTHHTFTYIYTYDQNGEPIRQSESLIPFFPQVGLAYEF
jgi:outer membrane receptor protein involved in Fe transport